MRISDWSSDVCSSDLLIHRKGAGEMALVLGAAEIMALKQLGREDDLRALVGGFAHECGYRVDIVVDAVGEGKLEGGDGYVRHILLRHPSEGWHPSGGDVPTSVWIPAFAGMTARRKQTGTCWPMPWKPTPPAQMRPALKTNPPR